MKTCPHSFPKTCILPQYNDILTLLPSCHSSLAVEVFMLNVFSQLENTEDILPLS